MTADFIQRLAERLKRPLPGFAAQGRFAPELSYGRQFGPPPASARRAAVLMLLYPHAGRWHLPLTLRPAHLLDHAGQISLPGGLIEPGESSGDAAMRELQEELGVADGIELLGRLSDFHVFVSNFRVTPWLGVSRQRPEWKPNPVEVAEVFEVPLNHLVDPANTGKFVVEFRGVSFTAPYFGWGSHKIWGATSMMLSELVQIVGELGLPD